MLKDYITDNLQCFYTTGLHERTTFNETEGINQRTTFSSFFQQSNIAGGGEGYILHIYIAGGGEEYILLIYMAGGGEGYTHHFYTFLHGSLW
jgi:hypothetical protein